MDSRVRGNDTVVARLFLCVSENHRNPHPNAPPRAGRTARDPTLRQGRANVGLKGLQDGSYSSVSAGTFGDTPDGPGRSSGRIRPAVSELLAPYEPAVAGEDTRATGRISSNFKLEEQT